ncbi:hypothetical protein NDU88_007991 [Pleurodeles waltl]|uniref:Uncharacterized protein n=1 Tax=Pleurodeles waltl TaxID=8319 RepID=A0AAV7RR14_PLEWA|nr:hypothetical protein NDU88_007991 [Pleurodeles waltl]
MPWPIVTPPPGVGSMQKKKNSSRRAGDRPTLTDLMTEAEMQVALTRPKSSLTDLFRAGHVGEVAAGLPPLDAAGCSMSKPGAAGTRSRKRGQRGHERFVGGVSQETKTDQLLGEAEVVNAAHRRRHKQLQTVMRVKS